MLEGFCTFLVVLFAFSESFVESLKICVVFGVSLMNSLLFGFIRLGIVAFLKHSRLY